MPNWELQFSEHPLFEQLSTAQTLIESTREVAEEVSGATVDDLTRLSHVVDRIERRLARVDPLAAAANHLNGLQQNLTKVGNQLQQFQSNRNPPHLKQANAFAENALIQAEALPAIESAEDIEGIQETAVSFRRSLGQHLRHVEEERQALAARLGEAENELAELAVSLEKLGERADAQMAQFVSQFSTAEDTRRQEAQQRLKEIQAKAGEIEERYSTAETERVRRFEELIAEKKDEWSQLQAKISVQREELTDEFELALTELRQWIDEQKKDVAGIVEVIAQTGMVEGYQRVANSERNAMWFWQGLTVLSIVGAVLLVLVAFPEVTAGSQVEWAFLARRAIAATALGALAAFAGRQSAKHGEKERRNRQMELEIASVGPFLARNPDDDQYAVKKLIAERAFGRGAVDPLEVDDAPATTNGLIDLIRMTLTELLKRVK